MMKLEKYLFLAYYLPLPLSALKVIVKNDSHPFHSIENLSSKEIQDELEALNEKKGISIRNIDKKCQKAMECINDSTLGKIKQDIQDWGKKKVQLIPYFHGEYPERLKEINTPPKALFLKGNLKLDFSNSISIIGTRKPSNYGKTMAFEIGKKFAERGFVVVNGFASGVDIEAIKGSLKAGGKIVGVFGSGLLKPYPRQNLPFFKKIIKENNGLFLSEQLPDTGINKAALASRNRISSGLTLGSVFIEGTEQSGTRWQYKYAKKQGKMVCVLRPKEHHEQAELPNLIIRTESDVNIINNVEDVDRIIQNLNPNTDKLKTLDDFL